MSDYKSLNKGLRLIYALAGHEHDGLAPMEIAEAAGLTASDATNYRKYLVAEGIVEEVPGLPGRYRLGPKIPQIAYAVQRGHERKLSLVTETHQRNTRNPH